MVVPLCSRTASYTAMTNDLGWTMKTVGSETCSSFDGVPDVASGPAMSPCCLPALGQMGRATRLNQRWTTARCLYKVLKGDTA